MFHSTAIKGNLTHDAELRYTPSGKPITNVRIAHNTRVQDETGKWVDGKTTFIQLRVWGVTAEPVGELGTGTTIIATLAGGAPEARAWTDQEGNAQAGLVYTARDIAIVVKAPKKDQEEQ